MYASEVSCEELQAAQGQTETILSRKIDTQVCKH
jgi:hypothetical protein